MALVITTPTELQNIKNNLAGDYELGANINMSGVDFDPLGGWDGADPFTGTFDGKGYSISNLTIDKTGDDWVGLFGFAEDATIQNVTLDTIDITGDTGVAGLIGLVMGNMTITNCHITGTSSVTALKTGLAAGGGLLGYVTNTTGELISVDDCSSTVDVSSASGTAVGGLIGYVYQVNTSVKVTNSHATGNVSGTEYVGGLIGNDGSALSLVVTNCYATGDVAGEVDVGGLIGLAENNTAITRCYTTGNVTSTDAWAETGGLAGVNIGSIVDCYARGNVQSSGNYVGGLVGWNDGIIDNSYSTGNTDGVGAEVGGLVGDNSGTVTDSFWDWQTSGLIISDGGTFKTTAEMKTKSTFTDAGWDFSTIWGITDAQNDGYPFLHPEGISYFAWII